MIIIGDFSMKPRVDTLLLVFTIFFLVQSFRYQRTNQATDEFHYFVIVDCHSRTALIAHSYTCIVETFILGQDTQVAL